MQIRAERAGDHPAIHHINRSAFEGDAEANLVDTLRQQATPLISLVAEDGDELLGHILFSPATLDADASLKVMGLAPMAVLPAQQNRGIGSALVAAGLARCRELGYDAVIVLGHPNYYPRFGFRPASDFDISCEYDVPPGVFMAMELTPGALHDKHGTARYHPAFNQL